MRRNASSPFARPSVPSSSAGRGPSDEASGKAIERLRPWFAGAVVAGSLLGQMKTRPLEEVRKTLWLALPMVIGQVASQLMHATDLAMVGRVGVVPLAAATFGATVFNFFWLVGVGPISAMSILVGEAHGAGDETRARYILRHGFVVAGVFGLIITLGMAAVVLFTPWWHLGQPGEVVTEARNYLLYLAATAVPLLLFITHKAYDEARGWPWLPFWFNVGSILLNVVLNWVFIYGKLGVPAMGLDGAGLATLLSRVGVLIVFWLYQARSRRIRAWWSWAEWWQFEWSLGRTICRLGLPIGLQILFEIAAFNCALFMMGWLPNGAVALAAHSIALNFAALAFMVPLGVSFAASIRVGQARGARLFSQARTIGWSTVGVAIVFMSVVALVFTLGRHQLPYLFLNDAVGADAPAVIALASTLLLFAAAFAVFDGVQVTLIGVLRGYRDVAVPTAFAFVVYWLICLPVGFFLCFNLDGSDGLPPLLQSILGSLQVPSGSGMGLGPRGIWSGLVLGLVTVSFVLVARFRIIARRAIAAPDRSIQDGVGGGAGGTTLGA